MAEYAIPPVRRRLFRVEGDAIQIHFGRKLKQELGTGRVIHRESLGVTYTDSTISDRQPPRYTRMRRELGVAMPDSIVHTYSAPTNGLDFRLYRPSFPVSGFALRILLEPPDDTLAREAEAARAVMSQRGPLREIDEATWPSVTVLRIAATALEERGLQHADVMDAAQGIAAEIVPGTLNLREPAYNFHQIYPRQSAS